MSTNDNTQKENPEDFFWQTYLDASKDEDETRPKNWEGSTTGILTFTGLFAATVAALIVESYKLLSPDSGDRTNALLEHLIIAMANTSSQNPVAAPPPELFSVSPSAVVTNVLWFTSLLIALICALLSTLVQEWSRNYVQDMNRRKALYESLRDRAFNHIYIRMGVNRYGMDQFVSWIVALVHLSVFLFACGLLVFLFPINHVVAGLSTVVLGSFIVVYCFASLIPLLHKSCLYRTPVSYMMAFVYWLALRGRMITLPQRSTKSFDSDHPQSTHNFQDIVTRQYTTKFLVKFLTDSRSQFVWERTCLHINHDAPGAFFGALPSFIVLLEDREALLSRMCANDDLMRTLYYFLKRSYKDLLTEPSSSSIDPEIFNLVAFLAERMYAVEVERHGEQLEDSVLTSLWLIRVIGEISRIAEVEGPSRLSARMCLAYVRYSLLKLCQVAFRQNMPVLSQKEVSGFFNAASGWEFRLGDRNPNAILLLLTAGSYDGWEWTWRHDATNLMPLHDDDCCRNWRNVLTPEGLAHVESCNALTTAVHVLESSGGQRSGADVMLFVLPSLGGRDSVVFPMSDNGRQKSPSPDFVSILRSERLDHWLEPYRGFGAWPRWDPNDHSPNYHLDSLSVDILRTLAYRVDFTAYRDDRAAAASPSWSSSPWWDDPPAVSPTQSSHSTDTSAVPQPPLSMYGVNDDIEGCCVPGCACTEPRLSSLPGPETSPAAEIVREDVHCTFHEEIQADTTNSSFNSGWNAAVPSTPPGAGPSGHEHDGTLDPDAQKGRTLDMKDGNPRISFEQDRANDAVAAGEAPVEREHNKRVADAVEGVTASTLLGVDGQEQQPVDAPESPGLRSVRIDDDRSSHRGMAQDGDKMGVIARVPGSDDANMGRSGQERAVQVDRVETGV